MGALILHFHGCHGQRTGRFQEGSSSCHQLSPDQEVAAGCERREALRALRFEGVQRATLRGLAHDFPDLDRPAEHRFVLGTDIAVVGLDGSFFDLREPVAYMAVLVLRRRGLQAESFAAIGIHTGSVAQIG
jgi:hypothetical protein